MTNILKGFVRPDLDGISRLFEAVDTDSIMRGPLPGLYRIDSDHMGWYLTGQKLHTDLLVPLSGDSAVNKILSEIRKFLSPRTVEIMQDFGLVHRRGVLMYGPPGSGKTSIINLLVRELAESHGVISFINPMPGDFACIGKKIHESDPKRFMLVIYEDFECWADDPGLLALLDGQASVPNTMYLATTNYFDKLDKRIVDRPSRFATKIEVGAPSLETRREFFKRHIPAKYLEKINLEEWVNKTDGLMIDHLKHLAQYVFVFEQELDSAIGALRGFKATDLSPEDESEF